MNAIRRQVNGGLPSFLVFASAALHASAQPAWSPFTSGSRPDKPTLGIAASDQRVLTASPTVVYRLDEATGTWFRSRERRLTGLLASPSMHYYAAAGETWAEDSTGMESDQTPYASLRSDPVDAAEDSGRMYLRFPHDWALVCDKGGGMWQPLSLYPSPLFAGRGGIIPLKDHLLLWLDDSILLSRDRGAAWTRAPGLPTSPVHFLQAFGERVYAGMEAGLYRSLDRGEHWSPLFPGASPYAKLKFDAIAGSGDTLWLGTVSGGAGVLRSADAGLTWEWEHAGMPPATAGDAGGIPPPAGTWPIRSLLRAGGSLWAAGENGVYRSKDGGGNWTAIPTGLPGVPLKLAAVGTGIRAVYENQAGHQVYAFDEAAGSWAKDSSLPSTPFNWVAAQGDTVFVETRGGLWRRAGAGSWEPLPDPIPQTNLGGVDTAHFILGLGFRGPESFLLTGAGLFHSGDGGRTLDVDRVFLPQAVFQGRKVEGRGAVLCWPDDSTFAPPKVWREFPHPIRKIALVGGALAVQAGSTLYYTSAEGASWKEQALPDSGMVLALRHGTLAGFTLDSMWALPSLGAGWQGRKLAFPGPAARAVAAGPHGIWAAFDGQLTLTTPDGQSRSIAWDQQPDRLAEVGRYLVAMHVDGTLDTFSIDSLARGIFVDPRRGTHPFASPGHPTCYHILAKGDFIAKTDGKVQISKDGGAHWIDAAPVPPDSAYRMGEAIWRLAGDPGLLFGSTMYNLYASSDTGKSWTRVTPHGMDMDEMAGDGSLLVAHGYQMGLKVTRDSARTWTTLLSPPGMAYQWAVASGRIYAATSTGVYRWGDADPIALRDPGKGAGTAVSASRRGWILVPGQGWLFPAGPGQRVDARGRRTGGK